MRLRFPNIGDLQGLVDEEVASEGGWGEREDGGPSGRKAAEQLKRLIEYARRRQ